MRRTLLLAAALVTAFGNAYANNKIDSIRIGPASIKAGSAVTITVNGDETQGNNCGLRINYGDGQGLDVKVVDRDQFPRTFTKTYANPGNYTVSVEGKRVTTHFPCNGRASATLLVEGAPAVVAAPPVTAAPAPAPAPAAKPAARAVGAGCAEGYQASYVAADGSYQCRPLSAAAKATRPACAAGYQASYAAQDGSFGCRPMPKAAPKPVPKTQCPPDLVYFENANGTFGCRKPR
jgi:hypothetical protein